MKGADLFAHVIGYREKNNNDTNGSKYTTTGSHHLNLEISKDTISDGATDGDDDGPLL